MPDTTIVPSFPLAGLDLDTGNPGVVLEDPGPTARFILRGGEAVATGASATLGFALPQQAGRSAMRGHLAALWLGPDEWLLLAPADEGQAAAYWLAHGVSSLPHALVDVGDRDAALLVRGPDAETALCAGCPLDLHPSAFPVGACTRTLFGKAEIVLWRIGDDAFRLETGRSFIAYVHALLRTAIRDLT